MPRTCDGGFLTHQSFHHGRFGTKPKQQHFNGPQYFGVVDFIPHPQFGPQQMPIVCNQQRKIIGCHVIEDDGFAVLGQPQRVRHPIGHVTVGGEARHGRLPKPTQFLGGNDAVATQFPTAPMRVNGIENVGSAGIYFGSFVERIPPQCL